MSLRSKYYIESVQGTDCMYYFVKKEDRRIAKLLSKDQAKAVIDELNHNNDWGWSCALNGVSLASYVKEYGNRINEKIKYCEEQLAICLVHRDEQGIEKCEFALEILKELKAIEELEL